MRTYDPSQPIIFTHMPKCGGSSFIRLLREWFGSGYHKLNQDETQDVLLPRIATRDDTGNWLPEVQCIHGHFDNGRGYGLPYFYPEINQYFTILRDPFDIAVSMFFFCKGAVSKENSGIAAGRRISSTSTPILNITCGKTPIGYTITCPRTSIYKTMDRDLLSVLSILVCRKTWMLRLRVYPECWECPTCSCLL